MKMIPSVPASIIVILTAGAFPSFAQTPATPAAAPARNLIANGGFERSFVRDNLWDGVASDGTLTLERDSRQALSERSNLGSIAMPPSIAIADINGDGKQDIVAASPKGYVFAYLNSGATPAAPAFTNAEIFPIYPSVPPVEHGGNDVLERRFAPRIALSDWRRTGAMDMFVGLYSGELLYYANAGSSRAPNYRQPVPFLKGIVQTADGGRLWANLVAPAVADMTRDGKPDLLLGEGTYSANNIHLLMNSGKSAVPQFATADRRYLAYGDGKEHLIPTIFDYNADGFPDIIAGDRTGALSVFLNPGETWKPGDEFKLATTISIGAQQSQRSLIAPCAADMNGDGLFDLVIGRTTGRIALALNTGSKAQPKFATLTDIKGTDRWGRTLKIPSSWEMNLSTTFGNALMTSTVVSGTEDPTLAPPEGTSAVKFSYLAPANSLVVYPPSGIPGVQTKVTVIANFSVQNNASYAFTMQTRGASIKETSAVLKIEAAKVLATRETRGERAGSVKVEKSEARESVTVDMTPTAGASWSKITKDVNVKFTAKELQELKSVGGNLKITFTPTPGTGVFYIDDVSLTKK